MGLMPKTRQNKTHKGLSPRHNKGETQNIKQTWATRMGQPLKKNFITKEKLKRFFLENFILNETLF